MSDYLGKIYIIASEKTELFCFSPFIPISCFYTLLWAQLSRHDILDWPFPLSNFFYNKTNKKIANSPQIMSKWILLKYINIFRAKKILSKAFLTAVKLDSLSDVFGIELRLLMRVRTTYPPNKNVSYL